MSAAPTAAPARQVALVGNPNVGKSTLFNGLTGLRQRVANFPGVTVDLREGTVSGPEGALRVFDLPGTYSLRPNAVDEAIVSDVLLGPAASDLDAVVVVLDATNLRRNLFLLSEVADLGKPLVVAINMVDEARRAGVDVPSERLRELLGVPVVETVASTGEGVDALRAALEQAKPVERTWRFVDADLEGQFVAAEGDHVWARARSLDRDGQRSEAEVAGRYGWINDVLLGADPQALGKLRGRSERIDRYLLHPVMGPLAFLLIMGLLFQSIFSWAGPLMDGIEAGFGWLGGLITTHLSESLGELGTSLVVDGIIGGVGSVIVFLPQILILFFFIGLLEDTGYMARAAFLVDRPLRAVGLSGRSFIPLLSGFACAIPGVMATRTISNRFERWLAILVTPLMTCSARLPVYTLLIAAFVPNSGLLPGIGLQGVIMLGLYLLGILSAVAVAFLVHRASGKQRGRLLPLVVELPPYRRPSLVATLLKLRVRGGDFLKRAGTVIFVISVVLWALMTFPRQDQPPGMSDEEHQAVSLRESYAGKLGHAIEPVVRPLGYDWKIGIGVIASFAAREVFVGTMGVVYSVGDEVDEESQDLRAVMQAETYPDGRKVFSLATVFSLLVFYVFALQCGATVAVVKREAKSWGFALGQLFGFLGLAYVSAFVVYQGMCALGYG